MMHRRQMDTRIAAYLAGDLQAEEADALLAHAGRCVECADRLRLEQATERILSSARPEAPRLPEDRSETLFAEALQAASRSPRKAASVWQVATVAGVVMVVAIWAGWKGLSTPVDPRQMAKPGSQPKEYAFATEKRGAPDTARKEPQAPPGRKTAPSRGDRKPTTTHRKRSKSRKATPRPEGIIVVQAPPVERLLMPRVAVDTSHLFVSVSGGETNLAVNVTRADDSTPGSASAVAFVPNADGAAWKVCSINGPPSESSTRYAYIQAPFPGEELAILTTVITDSTTPEKGE